MALSLALHVNAQLTVTGRVVNESGESLPSAHIYIEQTLNVTSSGPKGYFEFRNLRPGDYTVTVSYIGYEDWSDELSLYQDTSIRVVLAEKNFIAGEVIVRATRANVNDPVAYTNIDKSEIAGSGRTRDIPYLLELTPSVVATSDAGTGIGYTGLRIRGTDPSRINVTINGIPYNDSESHDVYWVNIPDLVSSVENIQVQRGVGISTQGAAAFGANINIQSRSLTPEPHSEIQSVAGSFNTFKNSVSAGTGLLNDNLSVDVRLSDISTDGYIDRAYARLRSYYVSAGWYTEKSLLRFTTFSGKEITYQAWSGVPAEYLDTARTYNPYTYENEIDDYMQSHYQLHWSWQPLKSLNINAALHYTEGKGYYEQYKEEEDLKDYLLPPVLAGGDTIYEADLVRRKWLDNIFYGALLNGSYVKGLFTLTAGGGWNRYDGDHFGRVIWSEYAAIDENGHQYYFNNGLKTDWNTFARANFMLSKSLNLYADLQYRRIDYLIDGLDDDQRDLSQKHIYNFFNPKAGASFDISENQELYLSFSIGNREPKRSNFTDAGPGETINPERLYDYELGYKYYSSLISAGANAYYMDYKDQLVLTGEINDVGSVIMTNVPSSYRAGLELMIALKPLGFMQFDGNLTLSRNRIKSFVEYVDNWDTGGQNTIEHTNTSLSFSPELIASGHILLKPVKNLDISLLSKYVGKQYIDNTSSESRMVEPYFVNNLRISYSIEPALFDRIGLFFEVINILDEKYESNAWVYSYFYGGERDEMIGYFPQAGRHYMLGLSLEL